MGRLGSVAWLWHSLGFLGEQQVDVEGHSEWPRFDIQDRRVNMARVWPHQDGRAHHCAIEDHAVAKPSGGGPADEALCHVAVAPSVSLVLAKEPEATPKLDQMVWARIGEREPSSGAENARCLGKILWREDADDKVHDRVMHRPFGPQIGNGERKCRPAPGSLPRRLFGNIQTQTDHPPGQRRSYAREVMACTRAGVEDAPRPGRALGIRLPDVPGNRPGDGVKLACVEEFRPVPQLRRAVAARSRTASPTA